MGTVNVAELERQRSGFEEKVVVLVRLRPLNEKEIARRDVSDWECVNDTTIIFRNNLSIPERSMFPTAYTFDRVFSSDCPTRQVYEQGAKEVALSVVNGINSSIFAYGQTSSGKTYTMSGITEYTMADIYDYIDKHKERQFVLKFSAMEIYNESVRDLLSLDSTPLRLLDDPERGTVVERLTEETLRDWSHLKELLSICEAQRQIGETSLNETSSRSHQILRLTIESSTREFLGNGSSNALTATVNFVDLAGSERASQSLSAGARLKEGCHINRSLLTLGTVIRKLSKGRNGHIPFRDSKLTRILQSSLGGNARTAIICTMSPARSHVEQSRNTLLFGSCAKEVTTNAQVNIVMSDKALVKHLQRELARLESKLRSSEPTFVLSDSAALIRAKDFEIEKLKEEVMELTLQRDHVQSQIEDLLQGFGNIRTSTTWAGQDHHYTALQVQKTWNYENPVSEACSLVDVKKSSSSEYSGHSRSTSDEHYPQLSFYKDNILPNDTSPQLLISTPKFFRADFSQNQEENEEQTSENSEDVCKEVQCIEIQKSGTKSYTGSSMLSNGHSGAFAPAAVGNCDRENLELVSPQMEKDRDSNCIHPALSIPSPEELTPWLLAKDTSSSQPLKLTRSKSCKACLMTSLSSSSFDNVGENEHTPPDAFEKDFTGRPERFQMKLPALNFGAHVEILSRKSPQTLLWSAAADELNAPDVKIVSDEDIACINTSYTGSEKMTKLQSEKHHVDCMVQETELKDDISARNVKDVGLDPIQHETPSKKDVGLDPIQAEGPLIWSADFKRLQREIIMLWHACNVSLVHRTFFFLLFKGDPKDSIYMEVELRRLSFLHDTFSQGNQTVEDGRTLTPASSMRALRRERLMLTKQMQKRLSEQDRENLYLKWGVGLNTKHRRLQLAYRLWTDTEDMDHIAESATLVAKLVGLVEPGQALKEMFGLNFTPRRLQRRFHGWRGSVISHF